MAWHKSPVFWTAVGSLATVLTVLITFLIYISDRSSGPDVATPDLLPTTAMTPTVAGNDSTAPSPTDEPVTSSPELTAGSAGPDLADPNPDPLYVADIPNDSFIKQPFARKGEASIQGKPYASSFSFQFNNCSNCTQDTEFNLPPVYSRFEGTVGLTDQSTHDDVIDGVQYFSIYANGKLVFGPRRLEYPQHVDFHVNVRGASRILLKVGNGTNAEYACWCAARFVK